MNEITSEYKPLKLAKASSVIRTVGGYTNWQAEEVDKLEGYTLEKFSDVVKSCRYFYKSDPIAATVVNKMVDIGISGIEIDQGQLSDNEYRVFEGMKEKLLSFMESCALEYLISGFVIPEINYGPMTKEELLRIGVKKYTTLSMPINMWVRDPTTIKINTTMVLDKPSYFVKIPKALYDFIMNNGIYPDGTSDPVLWNYLQTYYPDFVAYVKTGKDLVPYYNKLITRRKVTSDSPYPVPYLFPALEALKHKRNLRRMDYSIASRVISAIQLVKQGSDLFPIVEEDDDAFSSLRNQMAWRDTQGKDMERIFQLFTNHTVNIEWVYPPVDALLNEKKYVEVNQDIFFALGFPRILTTGETERSNSSDPEMAMISPVKTMEKMQRDLIYILKDIVYEISTQNKFKSVPDVRFTKVSLYSVEQMLSILSTLYNSGNLSRSTFAKSFGFTFDEEVEKRSEEEEMLVELGVPAFSPQPFSPQPTDNSGGDQEEKDTKSKNIEKKEKKDKDSD